MAGRIAKAVSFGFGGAGFSSFPTKQIIVDPFTEIGPAYGGAIPMPPFSLEQMVLLTESHPVHGASVEQKVEDIISSGPKFVQTDDQDDSAADEDLKDKIEKWWTRLFENYTDTETLQACWSDFETLGWGFLEVVRDIKGVVRRFYHIPGHTMRAGVDGTKFVQMRNGRFVWFKRWGVSGDIYARNGRPCPPETNYDKVASEVICFRKIARRSTWYGIPTYVSAIGHITLAVAARDYNILFFENSREPRHVFIVSGLDEDVDQMLDDLEKSLLTQHKDPHRNLLLPFVGDAKVDIKPLASPQTDGQFHQLISDCDDEILIAHRMPATRLGVSIPGSLSGPSNEVSNRVYKDGVVARGQAILEDRLNRFLNVEFPLAMGWELQPNADLLPYQISFEELDITDEEIDTNIVVSQVANNLITLNEGRAKLGRAHRDDFGDMTQSEYLAQIGMQGAPESPQKSAPVGATVAKTRDSQNALEEALWSRMHRIDEIAEELLLGPTPVENLGQ